MPRFRLLLLDANVVIALHQKGLWKAVVERCDVHLTQVVVQEAAFYFDADDDAHAIDLSLDKRDGRITVHEVDAADQKRFTDNFGQDIRDKLDPGERESLAFLYNALDEYKLCSSDAVVFRALGALRRSDQGVSLEEVFNAVGLTSALDPQFRKAFREQMSRRGFQEGIQGLSDLR